MKKKFLVLILMLLVTGCSADYNLKINNNSFKENINLVIDNTVVPDSTEDYIERDDQLTPFLEEKTASLITNDKFYKRKVVNFDDYTQVQMSYKYNEKEFIDSSSVNLCFEYPELDFSENYYIHLQGEFYCLYGDSIDIKIETNNKVYSNNADEVNGDTYIWHIDESNSNYVDIEIEVDKGLSIIQYLIILLGILLLIFIGYVIFKIYKKYKEENTI